MSEDPTPETTQKSVAELNTIEEAKEGQRLQAAAAAICDRRNAQDWPCNGLDFDEEMARVALAAADAVIRPARIRYVESPPFVIE